MPICGEVSALRLAMAPRGKPYGDRLLLKISLAVVFVIFAILFFTVPGARHGGAGSANAAGSGALNLRASAVDMDAYSSPSDAKRPSSTGQAPTASDGKSVSAADSAGTSGPSGAVARRQARLAAAGGDASGSGGKYKYDMFKFRRTEGGTEGITVVTQLTVDRLPSLKAMLKVWQGPASATVYITDAADEKALEEARDDSALLAKHVDFHYLHRGASPAYPVNPLRNVAMEGVTTPWMFLLDADFVPSASMATFMASVTKEGAGSDTLLSDGGGGDEHHEHASVAAAAMAEDDRDHSATASAGHLQAQGDGMVAYVAPAFSTDLTAADMPTSKEALVDKVDAKLIVPVNGVWCYGCHVGPTDFNRWYKATKSYKALYNWFYEPYVIVPSDVPAYDSRFVGYGNDKMSHIYELALAGYSFKVLPANYVLHIAHASAKWRADADKSMVNVDKLGCDFLSDVQRKYQHTAAEQVLSMPDQHSCWGAMSKCHAVTRLKVGAADGGAASTYMRKDVTYEQFMHKVAVSHGQFTHIEFEQEAGLWVPLDNKKTLGDVLQRNVTRIRLDRREAEPPLGPAGYALYFAGSHYAEQARIDKGPPPTSQSLSLPLRWTFEAWVKPYGPGQGPLNYGVLMSRMEKFKLMRNCFGTMENYFVTGGARCDTAIPDLVWTHLAVTHDSKVGVVKVLINGHVVCESHIPTNTQATSNGFKTVLGADADKTAFFDGMMDEVRLWKEVRSPAMIRAHMSSINSVSGHEMDLLAYWKFDEGKGSTCVDTSSNNHDLLLGGGKKASMPVFVHSTAPIS